MCSKVLIRIFKIELRLSGNCMFDNNIISDKIGTTPVLFSASIRPVTFRQRLPNKHNIHCHASSPDLLGSNVLRRSK